MLITQLFLGCVLAASLPADSTFRPLLNHVARQGGIWGIDNTKAAAIFYRCLDSITKEEHGKAVVAFVGSHEDRAYWVSSFLTRESYLNGNKPKPYLALALYANASDALLHGKPASEKQLHSQYLLSINAATLAKRLGLDALAVTFKTRAESLPLDVKQIGGPAVGEGAKHIYDSIPVRKSGIK